MSSYFSTPTGGKGYTAPSGTDAKTAVKTPQNSSQASLADQARKTMKATINAYGSGKTTVTVRRYGIK